MLTPNMPQLRDREGNCIPAACPPVIDAHVHVFPDTIFTAVRKWFDDHAWDIRYRLKTSEIFEYLLSRGVRHIVALQYAHKPGIARQLNNYMVEQCKAMNNRVTGMATVYPGEQQGIHILQEAFDNGLGGLKLHAHVQCFDMLSEQCYQLYDCCMGNDKPIIMHVGREPKSEAYGCDPYLICKSSRLEQILLDFPTLKICVPHLGFDETAEYRELLEKYDNLWLDTTMVAADYFNLSEPLSLDQYRNDRIMYGSDFPNIPYAWDRELHQLLSMDLPYDFLENITHRAATEFYAIRPQES